MAAVTTAAGQFQASTGTTQEIHAFTQQVRQVAIRNTHATQTLSVKAYYGETAAVALAKATAATAITSGAIDTFTVQAGQREVILKSPKARFVALACIASGATTTYLVHGTDFFD